MAAPTSRYLDRIFKSSSLVRDRCIDRICYGAVSIGEKGIHLMNPPPSSPLGIDYRLNHRWNFREHAIFHPWFSSLVSMAVSWVWKFCYRFEFSMFCWSLSFYYRSIFFFYCRYPWFVWINFNTSNI